MAGPEIIRRNSYDRLRALNNDQKGSTYICDCGQEYMNEETLKRHHQTNCKNRSIQCSFCQEMFSSTIIRDHLLSCGNKTDQCPRCRQFIRRSHFTYHYENNCASIDEIETPPSRPKTRSAQQHVPTNSNKPISRVDIPSNDYPENYSDQNSPRVNRRSPLIISNQINAPMTIDCEYCHNRCVRSDYKTHREMCLENPANMNRKQPPVIPSRSNQNQGASQGIVHIPCEICQQLIDLSHWPSHTQSCREREKQRLERRAETMSQQPVTEQFPCEYCQQLFLAKQLHLHEKNCVKNPENPESARLLAQQQPSPPVFLPTKRQNNRNHPISSNVRSPNNNRFAQYQRIDIDRTHIANRSVDNDRSINNNNKNQNYIQSTGSDENLLKSKNSSHRGLNNDNQSMRSNEYHSHENISQPSREGLSNSISQREKSSDSLRNMHDDQNPNNNAVNYRPSSHNDRRYSHHIQHESNKLKVINNHSDRPTVKPKKQSGLKRLFGHTSEQNAID